MGIIFTFSILFLLAPWSKAEAQSFSPVEDEPSAMMSDAGCFQNLSHLEGKMEGLLKSVYVKEFREAIRRSLLASIPEAVSRIDGLKSEIESLRREIQHQVRVRKSAEFILRDITKDPEGPFDPCRRTEKGGYCETLERYYMAKASNLANRGFLRALECYQKKGLP